MPCAEPHQAEVFHEFRLAGDGYPGEKAVEGLLQDCLPAFKEYVGVGFRRTKLDTVLYLPTRPTWRLGDREVTCSLIAMDLSDLDRSMRSSRR